MNSQLFPCNSPCLRFSDVIGLTEFGSHHADPWLLINVPTTLASRPNGPGGVHHHLEISDSPQVCLMSSISDTSNGATNVTDSIKLKERRGNNAPIGYIFFRMPNTMKSLTVYRMVFQDHVECILLLHHCRK